MTEGLNATELLDLFGLADKLVDGNYDPYGNVTESREVEPPPVHVTLDGNEWLVSAPYDAARTAAMRGVPGRKWDGKAKVDRIPVGPLSAQALHRIVDEWDLNVAPDAAAKLNDFLDADLTSMSRALDADLVPPALPDGYDYYGFQKAAVAYAVAARRALLALPMGAGKTLVALSAIEHEDAFPVLVVCPAVMKLVWAEEVEKWFGRTVNVVSGTTAEALNGADVTVVNWDLLDSRGEDLEALGFKSLVLDESHYAKNAGTAARPVKRTRAAMALAKQVPDDGMVLALTGTPVMNRPNELPSQLDILGCLGQFGGNWGFLQRYCGAIRNRFGWDFTGASNLDELNDRLRSVCMFRVTQAEMIPDLPDLRKLTVRFEGDAKVMAKYGAAQADVANFLANEAATAAAAKGEDPNAAFIEKFFRTNAAQYLAQIGTLLRLATDARLAQVEAWIEEFLDGEGKLLVFAQHRAVVDRLAERFGADRIWGGQPEQQRADARDRFQNDPDARVLVCSSAGGVGLTLTAAHDVLMVELPWTPAAFDQMVARAYGRMNDLHGVTVHTTLTAGADIDDWLEELIAAKRRVVDAVTDGVEPPDDVDKAATAATLLSKLAGLAKQGGYA